MRMKFYLAMLTALISANASALKLYNGILLSSKIETSNKATGEFLPDNAQYFSFNMAGAAASFAKAFSKNGSAGANVMVNSTHGFYLTNRTNSSQYYTYYYQLVCDGQFIRKIDNIRLEPNGRAQDAGIMYLSVYHGSPGNFTINAGTNVSGESSSYAQDSATLAVRR